MEGKGSVSMYFCNTRWLNHWGISLPAYLATLAGRNVRFGSLCPMLHLVKYYPPNSLSLLYSLACLPSLLIKNYCRFSTIRLFLLSSAAFFFSFLPQEDFSASLCIHSNFPHILKPQDSSLVSRSFLYRMNPFGSQERVIRSRFAEDPLTLKGEVSTDRPRTPPYLQAARSHFHCGLISS